MDAQRLHALVQGRRRGARLLDNYATRQAVNAACVRLGKPLVAGAVIRFDAQITVIDPRDPGAPCYACLFRTPGGGSRKWPAPPWACSRRWGVVGALQATEALLLVAAWAPRWPGDC